VTYQDVLFGYVMLVYDEATGHFELVARDRKGNQLAQLGTFECVPDDDPAADITVTLKPTQLGACAREETKARLRRT